ncbi:MAG: Gfo/Idh/MocA family oxidoreductase [Bacteroidaceae bacterium]|nr:Gfo/Idh/MocA family oxidoreductase [Bacteroidaceae bacterium]
MIQQLIDRYKRYRTERFLAQTNQYPYAFVGMGQHSLTNLYPVLHYLGVPLKYICVTSERKARLIERKFPHVKAMTSLDTILKDDEVKGIFVSASPSAHFTIASQILKSGKSLFIEKPPCQTLRELDALIDLQRLYGSPVAMVGLQKRYAPAVQILQKRLRKEHLINYDLNYLTGAYPEGNALFDLYIHPLDLVCFLFGKPEILVCQQVAQTSYILMLRHPHIVGTLELSTSYSWTSAEESLKVCTSKGIYRLSQMELLTFEPKHSSILGLPYEKVHKHNKTIDYLYARNNFTPTLPHNQIYLQGYYSEIQSFITAVGHGHSSTLTDITTIKPTYEVLMRIERLLTESS